MICPHCKEHIDEDSLFCDQCGREIFICPVCKNTGAGKFCTKDGSKLLSMKDWIRQQEEQKEQKESTKEDARQDSFRQVSEQSEQEEQKENKPAFPVSPNSGISIPEEIYFVSPAGDMTLRIVEDTVIGREGAFSGILGNNRYISRRHLRVWKDPGRGWYIEDLHSTNGTRYNGVALKPGEARLLEENATVEIAGVRFFVRFSGSHPSQTKRGET